MTKLELISKFAHWLDSRKINAISYHIGRERFDIIWDEEKDKEE